MLSLQICKKIYDKFWIKSNLKISRLITNQKELVWWNFHLQIDLKYSPDSASWIDARCRQIFYLTWISYSLLLVLTFNSMKKSMAHVVNKEANSVEIIKIKTCKSFKKLSKNTLLVKSVEKNKLLFVIVDTFFMLQRSIKGKISLKLLHTYFVDSPNPRFPHRINSLISHQVLERAQKCKF